jgi:hypothetical protein
VGAHEPIYYAMRHRLYTLIQQGKIPGFIRPHPGYMAGKQQKQDYIQLLKDTKIVLLSDSIYGYGFQKYAEVALAGALMLGTVPSERSEWLRQCMVEIRHEDTDEAIAAKIHYWLQHETERLKMARRCQLMALNHFTWKHSFANRMFSAVARLQRKEYGWWFPFEFTYSVPSVNHCDWRDDCALEMHPVHRHYNFTYERTRYVGKPYSTQLENYFLPMNSQMNDKSKLVTKHASIPLVHLMEAIVQNTPPPLVILDQCHQLDDIPSTVRVLALCTEQPERVPNNVEVKQVNWEDPFWELDVTQLKDSVIIVSEMLSRAELPQITLRRVIHWSLIAKSSIIMGPSRTEKWDQAQMGVLRAWTTCEMIFWLSTVNVDVKVARELRMADENQTYYVLDFGSSTAASLSNIGLEVNAQSLVKCIREIAQRSYDYPMAFKAVRRLQPMLP